jgi:hypothetical protein
VFHNLADRRIDGNPTFGLQFAKWYMDDPLIRAERKEAIEGQIHALADTHNLTFAPGDEGRAACGFNACLGR